MTAVTAATRHHTASAVVFDMERRLVLVVAHKLTGQWQFPGGHIDPNETGPEAAIREVFEETGVAAALWTGTGLRVPGGMWHPSPLMTVEYAAPATPASTDRPAEPAHRHIDLMYIATADSTTQTVAQLAEVNDVEWVPIDGIATADVRPDVPIAVPHAWHHITAGK